jgi:DNA mismatch endonuclease (patch repair protein)
MSNSNEVEIRRRIMQGNKSKDTSPEIRTRKVLHAMGVRFRLHRRDLPGRPDIILPKRKVCIFVHGCFWHRHQGCYLASTPRKNVEFWEAKFLANQNRDIKNIALLKEQGWHPVVIWECETMKPETLDNKLRGILSAHLPSKVEAVKNTP